METLFLNGGRQSLQHKILTIRKESISNLLSQKRAQRASQQMKIYLEPAPLIQSDHPVILAKAMKIVSPDDSTVVKARKLVKWVNENLRKRPVLSVPNALQAFNQRMGDCNEHAVLLAALARAAGIPAQVEAGLVYQKGRFYYHAWNVLYLGGWITADSVRGQLPADVTHLRFVRGIERQIDLVGMIGKVKIEVLSYSR
jgi:transglutaminase-like putative cysteine protease